MLIYSFVQPSSLESLPLASPRLLRVSSASAWVHSLDPVSASTDCVAMPMVVFYPPSSSDSVVSGDVLNVFVTILSRNTTGSGTANDIGTGKMVREAKVMRCMHHVPGFCGGKYAQRRWFRCAGRLRGFSQGFSFNAARKRNIALTLQMPCVPYNLCNGSGA